MEEKLRNTISIMYFQHDLKHCEEQGNRLLNKCMEVIDKTEGLEEELLKNDGKVLNYFITQVMMENM